MFQPADEENYSAKCGCDLWLGVIAYCPMADAGGLRQIDEDCSTDHELRAWSEVDDSIKLVRALKYTGGKTCSVDVNLDPLLRGPKSS